MMGKEAQVILANLGRLMGEKMEEPISHVQGWFNLPITIVVMRLYCWMLCGPRVPILLQKWVMDWKLG